MPITGTLNRAELTYNTAGVVSLHATVELKDDTLGSLGVRQVEVTDETVKAAVAQYVAQMLPTLSTAAGLTVTIPTSPTTN